MSKRYPHEGRREVRKQVQSTWRWLCTGVQHPQPKPAHVPRPSISVGLRSPNRNIRKAARRAVRQMGRVA
jgi:hypothetical protein